MIRSLAVIALAVGLAAPSQAQWAAGPGGSVGYQTDYSVVGTFHCFTTYLISGGCSVSGSTLLLTSGDATLQVDFSGASGSIFVSAVRSPVSIGVLTTSLTGDPVAFTFPRLGSTESPLFILSLALSTTTPAATNGTGVTYTNRTGVLDALCCTGRDFIALPVAPNQPAWSTYGAVVFDGFTTPPIIAGTSSVPVSAAVGLVPEPSSLVLLASGLLGVVAVRRRRRITPAAGSP